MSPEVVGQAEPRGHQPYRQWLSRTWEPDLPIALVIGINPNNATEKEDDGMTGFLVRLLRGVEGEFQCGGYVLVNCFDYRDRKPKAILDIDTPSSSRNIPTIRDKLKTCDFVVVSIAAMPPRFELFVLPGRVSEPGDLPSRRYLLSTRLASSSSRNGSWPRSSSSSASSAMICALRSLGAYSKIDNPRL
jgi:hypothetical protein